jgi:hypothetical protein
MNVQCQGNNRTAELGALQHLGAIGGIHNSRNTPDGGEVLQKDDQQPEPGEGPVALAAANKPEGCNLQLSASEWRLLRNYRTMKMSGQSMLVDISEEFALAFPAIAEAGVANATLRH